MSARHPFIFAGILAILAVACGEPVVDAARGADVAADVELSTAPDVGAETTAADVAWVSFDTSTPPGTWDDLERIELLVAPERVAAGETFHVSCNGVDASGIARDISPLQPVLQWQSQGGSDAEPLPEDRVAVRAGEWRISCAAALPDGRVLSDSAFMDVKPGPGFTHVPQISVPEVHAGEVFDARCMAFDEWNNPIGVLPEPVLWDVEGALLTTEDGRWNTVIAGEYRASCEQPDGTIGEPALLIVNLAEPAVMLPAYAPFPASGVVALGNFVRPQPVFVDRWGNQGNIDDVGGTLTATVSPEAVPVLNGFRFDVEGEYEMTIRWESGTGLTFQETTSPIRVNSFGPLVDCLDPAPNERVTAPEGTSVAFQYRVSDPWGVRRMTVEDRDVPIDSSGLAMDTRAVRRGWNASTIVSEDELGVIRATYCPFVAGEAWVDEGEFVPRALYLELGIGESDLLTSLAMDFSSTPDIAEFATGLVLPCIGDGAAEHCGVDEQFTVRSVTVESGSSRVGLSEAGELTLTYRWDSVDFVGDDGSGFTIRELRFDCGVNPEVNAGQLQLTRAGSCDVTGITDESHVAVAALLEEFVHLADSWAALVGVELQTALRTLDPMGTAATATRAALDDPRERRFDWQSRLDDVVVTHSTLRLEYALRVRGESVHALPAIELPYPLQPPAQVSTHDAIVLGEGALWAWSVAIWRTGLPPLWFEDTVARVESDQQALLQLLVDSVDIELRQPFGFTMRDGTLGITFGEFAWPDVTLALGETYQGTLSILYWGENAVQDTEMVENDFWRDPVLVQADDYQIDFGVLAFFERHLRYVDPILRTWLFSRLLPDIPRPQMFAGETAMRFIPANGTITWADGYGMIRGVWAPDAP